MTSTLHEDQYIFFYHILLSSYKNEKYFSQKLQRKSKHILSSETFSENHVVYEIMRTNGVEPNRPQMTIWLVRLACWVPKATNTHSEFVIFIFHSNNGCTNTP